MVCLCLICPCLCLVFLSFFMLIPRAESRQVFKYCTTSSFSAREYADEAVHQEQLWHAENVLDSRQLSHRDGRTCQFVYVLKIVHLEFDRCVDLVGHLKVILPARCYVSILYCSGRANYWNILHGRLWKEFALYFKQSLRSL